MINNKNFKIFLTAALLSILIINSLKAQEIDRREHLLGNWNGERTKLSERGINFEAVYTGDVFSDLLGGVERHTVYIDNIDLKLNLNTGKLFNWPGGTIFIYGLGNQGKNPSKYIGDVQTVDNIAAHSTWKLYEAWIQQSFFKKRLSILTGLYNLNSEFQVIESAKLFLNSSHGIGKAFSQSGRNGPSIFPTTSLAFRLKLKISNNFLLQSAVFNGTSGDPSNPEGTKITFPNHDGILSVTELQYSINRQIENENDLIGKFTAGFWLYSAKFPEVGTTYSDNKIITGNLGFYLMGEYKIFGYGRINDKGLNVFSRLGFSNSKINRFVSYLGFGVEYSGLITGSNRDQLGLAFAGVYNGRKYISLQEKKNIRTAGSEMNIELTYLYDVFRCLSLQPDFQYVIHPDTNPLIKNALAAGIRCVINF